MPLHCVRVSAVLDWWGVGVKWSRLFSVAIRLVIGLIGKIDLNVMDESTFLRYW